MDEFQYKLYLEKVKTTNTKAELLILIRTIDTIMHNIPVTVYSLTHLFLSNSYHVLILAMSKMQYSEDIPDYLLIYADEVNKILRQSRNTVMPKPQRHTATYSRIAYSKFEEVIEYWMDGKDIQYKSIGHSDFIDYLSSVSHIDFLSKPGIDYRIKPKD